MLDAPDNSATLAPGAKGGALLGGALMMMLGVFVTYCLISPYRAVFGDKLQISGYLLVSEQHTRVRSVATSVQIQDDARRYFSSQIPENANQLWVAGKTQLKFYVLAQDYRESSLSSQLQMFGLSVDDQQVVSLEDAIAAKRLALMQLLVVDVLIFLIATYLVGIGIKANKTTEKGFRGAEA